jgi:hypothetical protein
MRPSLVIAAALIAAAAIVGAGVLLLNPDRPLIVAAQFEADVLTPNADGDGDVVLFAYELARAATVGITLESEGGETYVFRSPQANPAGAYRIAFSGVVAGYLRPDEEILGAVERRLIPDGVYTWTLTAAALQGDESLTAQGTLTVRDSDVALPLITDFTVSPRVFTPNQDGVGDLVYINVYLQKSADLTAYLIGAEGERVYIAPRQDIRQEGEAGWQEFTYAGGIDIGADPPPDGDYTVYVEAQDLEGQRIVVTSELTIAEGGKPRAGILGQGSGADVIMTVQPYDATYASTLETRGEALPMPDNPEDLRATSLVVPLGDMLVFRLTVENYGSSPLRTTGPMPGTVYDQRQIAASLAEYEQDGAWRVGIQCETSEQSYPWRWALGTPEQLTAVSDPTNDNVYYYLPPGTRSVVWGAVRLTDIVSTTNPQQCWAGLIHEGVNVYNNRIGVRDVLIADTTQGN